MASDTVIVERLSALLQVSDLQTTTGTQSTGPEGHLKAVDCLIFGLIPQRKCCARSLRRT
jgi:hypothetical protein